MKKRVLALAMVAVMAAMTACSSSTPAPAASSSEVASVDDSAEVEASVEVEPAGEDDPEGGFTEYPIWEDEEVADFLNVSGVYFQPVPMSGGNESIENYNLHFEADVSTLPNDLGYGTGEWVPYMSVDFEIIAEDGTVAADGTFMPMNADDGPHYGANIMLADAGTYSVRIVFNSPGENGYLIHLDDETGPGGSLEDLDWPLELYLENVWDYVPQEW